MALKFIAYACLLTYVNATVWALEQPILFKTVLIVKALYQVFALFSLNLSSQKSINAALTQDVEVGQLYLYEFYQRLILRHIFL